MELKIRAWIGFIIFVKISKKNNNKNSKIRTENSQKFILCTVLVFHKGIFYSKKDVFNWDYDSSKFYKLLYSKKEKGSSSFFFRRFFFL
jgi:hypothetical protein